MPAILRVRALLTGLLGLVACGRGTSWPQSAAATMKAIDYRGTDRVQQEACTLVLEDRGEGLVEFISLEGLFIRDYKVRMPLSSLYGKTPYRTTLSRADNMQASYREENDPAMPADLIIGEGWPLMQNTSKARHTLIFKPSLANPESVTYRSEQRVLGVLRIVTDDLSCTFKL